MEYRNNIHRNGIQPGCRILKFQWNFSKEDSAQDCLYGAVTQTE